MSSNIRNIKGKMYMQISDSAMPIGEAMRLEKKYKADGFITEIIKTKKQRVGTMDASMATLWIRR
jgi:hypothetical protein